MLYNTHLLSTKTIEGVYFLNDNKSEFETVTFQWCFSVSQGSILGFHLFHMYFFIFINDLQL